MSGTYDGSIKIDTHIDTNNFNRGVNSLGKGMKSIEKGFSKIGSKLATIFGITAILNFSNQASQMASNTEASVQRLIDIYGQASEKVGDFIDSNARALGMSKSATASYASVYGNLFSVWADQATNANLTNHYLNMTAVVASKTGRDVADVQERIRSGLLGNTEAIEDLGIFVNVKTIEMTDAFKRMADGKSWEKLDAYTQQQIRTMAILEQATNKYGTEVANTSALTRMRFNAAFEDFKNTWGRVVNKILLPILRVGTMVLNVLTRGLQIIAKLSGKTIDTTTKQSNAIAGSVDNQNDLTDAVKGTNKELKKSLAGFDELNTLSQDTSNGSGGGSSSAGLSDLGLEEWDSDFNGQAVADEVDAMLTTIMGVVGGALVAIGVILLCTGHVGWGIGFIVAGATLFAVTEASIAETDIGKDVIKTLASIMGAIGGALIAIGVMLLFLGSPKPLAIGFIIAGAAAVIGSVASLVAFDVADVKSILSTITAIAGGAMLALGVMLCVFAGPTPLAIGLIVAGAISLCASIALNWSAIPDAIKDFFQKNAGLVVGISLAMLVLGIILVATGASLPLGIGLILVGATALVATVALNWDKITTTISSFIQKNAGLVAGVSFGLLVLGIILVASGVGIPLGIGLIAAGAVGLVTVGALNWDAIHNKIKETWNKIKDWWDTKVAKYFTASYWGQKGKDMINGLIKWVVNGINKLIDKLNSFGFKLPDVLGGGRVGFNISKLSIPQLAQGTVLPGGKPFMAIVNDQPAGQTNIEAPLGTIKQGVAEVLANMNVGSGFNGRIEVPIYLDSRQIALAVREAENNLGSQTVFGGFANAY
jgi:hypothetical protein